MEWTATAIDVPGDGTCLFHAIGLQIGIKGNKLKSLVISIIEHSSHLLLHEQSIKNWIEWDLQISPGEYADKLRLGLWGGSIETTLLASLINIPILVYEPKQSFCRRIADSKPDLSFPKLNIKHTKEFICILFIHSHYMILEAKKNQ